MNELSHEARRLIASVGDADGPSLERQRELRKRFLLKLGAGVAAGAVNTALTAGTAKAASAAGAAISAPLAAPVAASAGLSMTSVVSGLLIGGAVGASVVVPAAYLQSKPAPEQRPAAVIASASVSRVVRPAPASRLATSAPSAEQPPDVAPAEIVQVEPRGPKAVPTVVPLAAAAPSTRTTTATASRLAEETALLTAAQRAIASGRGSDAMNVVNEYGTKFPRGALREESLALRVLALCLTGSLEEARASATAFVAAAPTSPLLPRLEASCVSDVPGIAHGRATTAAPGHVR